MKIKKQTMKRTLTLLLCGLMLFGATSCSGNTSNQSSGDAGESISKPLFEGTHILSAENTAADLVKNGRTDYVLVMPSEDNTYLNIARKEFLWLFKQATGIDMRVVYDHEGLVHTSTSKYISLGETTLLKSSGIEIDHETLGTDGGRIVTKDNTVYIVGGTDKGTMYTIYTFMSLTFNFEQYWRDCYEIDKVKNVKLKDYQVTDIPDIAYRINNYSGIYTARSEDYDMDNFVYRFRYGTTKDKGPDDPYLPIHTEIGNPNSRHQTYHNTDEYLPEEQYQDTYPEWFSTRGRQLCYTARGNEEKLEAMITECANKVIYSLQLYNPQQYPTKNTVTISIEDGSDTCECSGCLAEKEKYGTPTAAVVKFVNRMAEKIDAWMNDPANAAYKRENFCTIFFAYVDLMYAPVVKNNEGKWVAMDDSVKLRDDVGVFIAPIDNLDYQVSIYNPINDRGRDCIDGWDALTDNMYYWTYSTNFGAYLYMYDSFNFFNAEGYQYLCASGAKYIFNQSQGGEGSGTAWHNLKMYLDYKLQWNCNQDVDELVDNYFKAMFKDAAPTMKKLYNEMRSWNAYVCETNGLYKVKSVYGRVIPKEYWPIQTLKGWMGLIEEAWGEIEKYKDSDPDLYRKLYYRIGAEYVSPAYKILSYQRSSLTLAEQKLLIQRFKDIVKTLGMTSAAEGDDNLQKYAENLV